MTYQKTAYEKMLKTDRVKSC